MDVNKTIDALYAAATAYYEARSVEAIKDENRALKAEVAELKKKLELIECEKKVAEMVENIRQITHDAIKFYGEAKSRYDKENLNG